jgi:hypothetical protein
LSGEEQTGAAIELYWLEKEKEGTGRSPTERGYGFEDKACPAIAGV